MRNQDAELKSNPVAEVAEMDTSETRWRYVQEINRIRFVVGEPSDKNVETFNSEQFKGYSIIVPVKEFENNVELKMKGTIGIEVLLDDNGLFVALGFVDRNNFKYKKKNRSIPDPYNKDKSVYFLPKASKFEMNLKNEAIELAKEYYEKLKAKEKVDNNAKETGASAARVFQD